MKRNRQRLFVVTLFFVGVTALFPQKAVIRADLRGREPVFFMNLLEYNRKDILDSLHDGNIVEVRFELKLYRENRGLGRLFGNRLMDEAALFNYARYDYLTESYIIHPSQTAGVHPFLSSDSIITEDQDELFNLLFKKEQILMDTSLNSSQRYYISGRISVKRKLLDPPLHMLSPLLSELGYSTNWITMPLSDEANE